MSIAENIKRLRTEHGMSQAEFGAIAGVTDKAVSTWEKGIKEPRMGAIQKIADYFHIKKSDIIEDTPADNTVDTTAMIKAALWGGDKDFTQEDLDKMWEDVRSFADFVAAKRKKEK